MSPSINEERLSWPERLKVVCLSLGFVLVLSFLGAVFWNFNPLPKTDRFWDGFWEPIGSGRHQASEGSLRLLFLVQCLVLLPLAIMVFVAGVVQGLRGRRTRLAAWILRNMNDQEVRKRHEEMLESAEAAGDLTRMERVGQTYIPQRLGLAILFGFLLLGAAAMVWSATR